MNTRTEPLDVPIRFRVTRSMAEFLDSQGNRSKVLQGLIERERTLPASAAQRRLEIIEKIYGKERLDRAISQYDEGYKMGVEMREQLARGERAGGEK